MFNEIHLNTEAAKPYCSLNIQNNVTNNNEIDRVSEVDLLVPNLYMSVAIDSVTPLKLNLIQCGHAFMRSLFSQILTTDTPSPVSIGAYIASS